MAEQYAISDVGLAKIWRSLNVPHPGRGYWTKLRYGKPIRRPPLPDRSTGTRAHVVIRKSQRSITKPKPPAPVPAVEVSAQLVQPHRLIVKSMRALNRARPDHRGLLVLRRTGHLDLEVGPETKERALALEDEELMAEGEHLGLERGPAAEQGLDRCENGQKGRGHRRSSLAQVREILNDDGPDQFLGRHRW